MKIICAKNRYFSCIQTDVCLIHVLLVIDLLRCDAYLVFSERGCIFKNFYLCNWCNRQKTLEVSIIRGFKDESNNFVA